MSAREVTSHPKKSHISNRHFCPGGMAPYPSTRSIRTVRDTPVAHYCAPGVNSTCRLPSRPLIAVLSFLHVLSVSYLNRLLWRCGQLWPYVGMGSLGTCLHQDCTAMGVTVKISTCVTSTSVQNANHSSRIIRNCNAMGDAATISPCVPSTCVQNGILSLPIIHIIPSCQIYVAIDNPLLIPSVSCLTNTLCLLNDVRVADNLSHSENLKCHGCRYFSHLYKFRDGIQVT